MARILVVDEDKYIRQLYYAEFSEMGYEVFTAAAGFELMVQCDRSCPDVIVLDIKMGDCEGGRLLQKIRGFAPGIPVVVCSVYDFSRKDTGRPAADRFVVKSFDLTRLKAEVESALRSRTPFLEAV
jgi:DNA-binding NtrC family response regulator